MRWRLTKLKSVIIILSILTVVLLYRTYQSTGPLNQITGTFSAPLQFDDIRLSNDLRHGIWENIYSSQSEYKRQVDVTIVTQCSVNRLHNVVNILEYWKGPVSIAVFLPGDHIKDFNRILVTLTSCNELAQSWLTVHGVIPMASPPYNRHLAIDETVYHNCNINQHQEMQLRNYELNNIAYPVNLLRNTAIKHVKTSHILVLDIDMLPSKSLRKFLSQSSLLNREKTAFVVPAFEMKEGRSFPEDKHHLLKQWDNGDIRPFYEEVCWKCQKYTQYDVWRSDNIKENHLLYEVSWHDPWEPFYISHRKHVWYDERFEQYGFNRISQLCDLFMRETNFVVLRDAFLIHSGFKTKGQFHDAKDEENDNNKIIYRKLKQELIEKYPLSKRRC